MILQVIATGSSGNCYLLYNDTECLIIEMGVPFMDVKKAMDFNIQPIVGALVSHPHADHYKFHEQYEKAGIPTYKPWIDGKSRKGLGNFNINPFPNPHGDIESWGFLITHYEIGVLLFVTDAEYVQYDFSAFGVNHILCECNYTLDLVDTDSPNFKHKIQGHMADTTCTEFVKHNNSPKLRNVVLLHSGSGTLDEESAIERIKSVVDADVEVNLAVAGLEIKLNKEAF